MIVVAYHAPIELLPPGISLIRILKDRGEDVVYIGLFYTEKTKIVLAELGIPYRLCQRWPVVCFREHPFLRLWFLLVRNYRAGSLCRWFQRKFLWRSLQWLTRTADEPSLVIWTINMHVAALFGDGLLRYGNRHVAWLTEYGEEVGRNWSGFSAEKFYANSVLIESEINRARMLQKDKKLKMLPFVLPNKPYGHPRTRNMVVQDSEAAKVVSTWKDKTVFLYQGSLGADRKGIVDMIGWICEGFPDAVVAVMSSWSPKIDDLRSRYKNFSYVPFVRAPHHLEVTSHATIGLAVYSVDQVLGISPLNGLYCAPNKTFEYGGFGIPLLCNNPPGLRDSVGAARAAICLDKLNREEVVSAGARLLENYRNYSANASRFFETVDTVQIVGDILDCARGAT